MPGIDLIRRCAAALSELELSASIASRAAIIFASLGCTMFEFQLEDKQNKNKENKRQSAKVDNLTNERAINVDELGNVSQLQLVTLSNHSVLPSPSLSCSPSVHTL